jgi:HEAT repeat protein
LETALQDRIASVRQEAAWALGHIGDVRAAPALVQALSERNAELRFAVAFALAEVGALDAAPALVPLLQHTDDRTQLAAASALAFLDNSQGLAVLSETLHSRDTWKRFTALISLLRLGTPESHRLLADCHDSDMTLASVVEAGLRLGGAGAATNMLCTAKDNDSMTEDFRHFGARALVLFNDPGTLPALQANANDPREDVRVAVRVAIHRIQKKLAENKLEPDKH